MPEPFSALVLVCGDEGGTQLMVTEACVSPHIQAVGTMPASSSYQVMLKEHYL